MTSWRWLTRRVYGVCLAIAFTAAICAQIVDIVMSRKSAEVESIREMLSGVNSAEAKLFRLLSTIAEWWGVGLMVVCFGLLAASIVNASSTTLIAMYRTMLTVLISGIVVATLVASDVDAGVIQKLRNGLCGQHMEQLFGTGTIILCAALATALIVASAMTIRMRVLRLRMNGN